MQLMRWIGFFSASPDMRTMVHLFPAAKNVSGPYPVQCRISVFGYGLERQQIVLEGCRCGQPDGIWLEDAFPSLKDESLMLRGVQIEISAAQPHINLGASKFMVEFVHGNFSTRYTPELAPSLLLESTKKRVSAIPFQDQSMVTSLLMINPTSIELDIPHIERLDRTDGRLVVRSEEVVELNIQKEHTLARPIEFEVETSNPAVWYVVYRQPETKRILSVVGMRS